MGNQRQVLKGNIEKDLVTKIEAAKDVLDQLHKSLEVSKQGCVNAKEEITSTADSLQEILTQRKNALIKEVDTLHNAQVRPLQDAIKSTYITMGRLQSMLTNLESFDQSQLVNIRVPDVDTSFTLNEPAQITPSLECENLKEDLKDWGNVSLDGFQCCMMDIPENPGQMYEKRLSSVSGTTTSSQQLPSDSKEQEEPPQKLTESRKAPSVDNLQMTWSIENWLSRTNRKVSCSNSDNDSKDEFLIIPSNDDDLDFIVPFQEADNNSCKMSEPPVNCDDGESGSSIMCIERESQSQEEPQQEDLTIWLKPKKTKLQQQPSLDQELPQYIPPPPVALQVSAISNQTDKTTSTIKSFSTEKRILDFPCLLMDDETWIRKKKSKPSPASSICSNGTNCFIQSQRQQNLIPAAYALPNPFWLKKYKIRC